jgi:OmpA-OmpF porin, OOP family
MKRLKYSVRRLILALIILSIPFCKSFATEIKQYPYAGKQDVVKEVKQNTFVICKKCPVIQDLSTSRALPKIAIKAHPETIPVSPSKVTTPPSSGNNYKEKTVIYFKFDRAERMNSEKEKLEQVSKTISRGIDHIKATGYTCKIGGKKYNEILARRRAESVASFLEDKGIKVSEVIGKGKCCYASDKNKLNRRVELEVKNK